MKILVLSGSPRRNGNTAAHVAAFAEGARAAGHTVDVIEVCRKKIAGCLACDACRRAGDRRCVQQDDMRAVYPLIDDADMLVLASPIYYYALTGQLQCAVSRLYALDRPLLRLKKSALLLSAAEDVAFDGAILSYHKAFQYWLGLEDMGVITAAGDENQSEAKLAELRAFGESL
ncbi:MAG: flavodoxin family protein [Butyricicoccus sp.]|nr:flavodoxin family protein [Butyricicoccus sp.]